MLTENDIELLNKSSMGKSILFIAPTGKDFEENFQRIVIDNSEISILTNSGEELEAALRIEDIADNLKDGSWEIREAHEIN